MNVRKTNNYLLITVLLGVPLELFLNDIFSNSNLEAWSFGGVLHYLVLVLIGIIMVRKSGGNVFKSLPYNVCPKLKTMLLVVVVAVAFIPVLSVLSYLGGVVFGNTFESVASLAFENFAELTFPQQLFTIAVIPAVFEEVLYRGFIYEGYRNGKGARTAILLTALLFGTFHMIPQQAVYAMFAGAVLAIVRELTGSMWPGMLLHLLNNGRSAVELQLVKINPNLEKFMLSSFMDINEDGSNIVLIFIEAAVALVVMALTLKKIAEVEGREEDFKTFFKNAGRKTGERLVTPGLVMALLIEVGVMVGVGPLMDLLKKKGAFNKG